MNKSACVRAPARFISRCDLPPFSHRRRRISGVVRGIGVSPRRPFVSFSRPAPALPPTDPPRVRRAGHTPRPPGPYPRLYLPSRDREICRRSRCRIAPERNDDSAHRVTSPCRSAASVRRCTRIPHASGRRTQDVYRKIPTGTIDFPGRTHTHTHTHGGTTVIIIIIVHGAHLNIDRFDGPSGVEMRGGDAGYFSVSRTSQKKKKKLGKIVIETVRREQE